MENLMTGARAARSERLWWVGVPFAAALALIVGLYWETFKIWWWLWTEPASFYAHAMFVPLFVGVMAWRNREALTAARWRPSWGGLALIVPAMFLLLIARDTEVRVLQSLSFVVMLLGGALLLIGPSKTRVLLFPLLFVLTMIPLVPDQFINIVAFPIQVLSTKLATFLLNVMTLHAVREGTMIQLDDYRMAVEGACSGFRTLISLLTFAGAFAYLVEGALWKRWTLFLSTIPLSLIINGLRITLIGAVGELVSRQAAATFHDYSGFIVLILAFLFLFNFARLLRCGDFLGVPLTDPTPRGPVPAAVSEDAAATGRLSSFGAPAASEASAVPGSAPTEMETPWWRILLSWRPTAGQLRRVLPYILAIDLVLGLSLALQNRLMVHATPEPPIATSQVPMQVAADGVTFTAHQNAMTDKLPKEIQDQLNPTRLINRDYDGSDGSHVSLFMTAGNARWTFHDPHTCSLGSGAILHDAGILTIPTQAGPLRVLECRFQYNGSPDMFEMMYCYVVKNAVLQKTDDIHRSLAWQTLFGDAGKPSYFLRFTQVAPGTEEQKRRQLMRFVAAVWTDISPVLQGKVKAIPEPPPVPVTTEH